MGAGIVPFGTQQHPSLRRSFPRYNSRPDRPALSLAILYFPRKRDMTSKMASCLFCKIIKGDIPSFKLYESDKVFAFLDISPLTKGHALVIPKFHGVKLHDIPDDSLTEILPVAKKLAQAAGATDYNVLQNNGAIAHQVVEHVHFHMIPKPNDTEGLVLGPGAWPAQATDMEKLKATFEEMKAKM
ncbi:hypothetical protein RB595_007700 [Gaeumannomyces hyphopodioides]